MKRQKIAPEVKEQIINRYNNSRIHSALKMSPVKNHLVRLWWCLFEKVRTHFAENPNE